MSQQPTPAPVRRPLRDNPALILFWIALLVAALAAMVAVADRSAQLSPDFLSEVVLSALAVADLTILFGLLFVLARNVIKLLVERRRGLPFARFRSKLVLTLLGMTLVPTLLVLLVGSELIRNSANRWFSAPIDDVLGAAREVAADYYQERQAAVEDKAARIAQALAAVDLSAGELGGVRDLVAPDVTEGRVDLVEIYRIVEGAGVLAAVPVVDVASPSLPPRYSRAGADRLAQQAVGGGQVKPPPEPVGDAGELVRAVRLVRSAAGTAGRRRPRQ